MTKSKAILGLKYPRGFSLEEQRFSVEEYLNRAKKR